MLGAYARKTPPTLGCAGCLVPLGTRRHRFQTTPKMKNPPRELEGDSAPKGVRRLRAWAERPEPGQLDSWRLNITHTTTPTMVRMASVVKNPKPRPSLSSGSCSKCPFIALPLSLPLPLFLAMSRPNLRSEIS